ncbi:hypothetical protein [Streptomyces sp. cg35]|uniref:hypothetical protein n=1 Tax=Streptomyces sp. cg35 TaxID=3421650 RepID=UPI003D1692B6
MRAQESRISVAVVETLEHYPNEVWEIRLTHLDMFTEEVLDELDTIAWCEGNHYPNHSSISAKTGKHNWGASGSFADILMEVSSNTGGGIGAVAITAAIKSVYEKFKKRSQGGAWQSMPSAEEAVSHAKSSLYQHYNVAFDSLTVVRSDADAESLRHDFEFSHSDGRKFGATVGAIKGIPSCIRVWAEGDDLMPRPDPTPPDPGN